MYSPPSDRTIAQGLRTTPSWTGFQELVEQLIDGVTVQDLTGKLVYANALGARVSGYDSPEALLAAPVGDYVRAFEVMDVSGAPMNLEDLPGRRAIQTGQAQGILRVRERATGHERWTDVRSFLIRDSAGRPEFVANVIRDVTASMETLRAVEASSKLESEGRERAEVLSRAAVLLYAAATEHAKWLARLQQLTVGLSRSVTVSDVMDTVTNLARALFEADAAGVWVLTRDRAYLELGGSFGPWPQVTRPVQRLPVDADYPVNHVLGTGEPLLLDGIESIVERFPAMRKVAQTSPIAAVANAPIKVGGEIIGVLAFRYNTGQTFSDDYVTALRTFSKELGQALERTRVHSELEEAKKAAEDARRVAEAANGAKSSFLATMSHELRTPINAILGFAELLELDLSNGQAVGADYVARIRSNTAHLLDIINDILDWSKVEAGHLTVDTAESLAYDVIQDALSVVRHQATARNLELTSECHQDATYVGDPLRVRQILLNLLSNAIKFTPPGGRISLSCRMADGVTSFSVRDSGIGVEDTQLESIFEPFVQAAAVYTRRAGGTGLGLSISRRLAQLMAGSLVVESVPGRGSTFTLTLPATEQ